MAQHDKGYRAPMVTLQVSDIIEALPSPVLIIDDQGTVMATNAPLRKLLGDHVTGRHYITALRQPALLEQIEIVLKSRKPALGRYLGREAGRDTNYNVQIRAAADKTILTFEDRTAAEDVGQLRRDFVANVSHELRTPLTALHGFIETLRGAARDDPAARDRFLGIMERETGRMSALVDDLLSLSRLEANERVRPVQEVVLSNLVSSTVLDLQPVLNNANATVRIDDQSDACKVPAEPGELHQVIGNLVENAVKYGAPEQEVLISLSAPTYQPSLRTEGLRLSVTDTGQGIASHHIARLTERFYRVDTHRSREVGGTGLGLAIVKHIINRHRGRLQIESELGVGTTVSVLLPTISESINKIG